MGPCGGIDIDDFTFWLTFAWGWGAVSSGRDDLLDQLLEARANPHRREIVYVLGLQPLAVHQLADLRGLSLPAIRKHLKVLENAGLISRRKKGRTNYLTHSQCRVPGRGGGTGEHHADH